MNGSSKRTQNYNVVKDYIKEKSIKEKSWTTFMLSNISEIFEVPQREARSIALRLRLDPEIRSKLVDASSRFKPKAFFYDSPENKVKDSKNLDQFDFSEEDILVFNDNLKEYLNVEGIKDFSILVYICEKMKTSGLRDDWKEFNIGELCNLILISESKILDYINILKKKKLVFQSPYTLRYRLTISEEERVNAEKNLNVESTDPNLVAQAEANKRILQNKFEALKASDQFQSSLQRLMKAHTEMGATITLQARLLDALSVEEKNVQTQKVVLAQLSESYNELSTKYENLEKKYKDISEELRITDGLLKNYRKYVENKTIALTNSLNDTLVQYFMLSISQKNNPATNNKVKYTLRKVIEDYQKEIETYKKEFDE